MTIVYTNHCLCKSTDKEALKRLRIADKVEVRRISFRKDWREEAEQYNMPYPFVLRDGAVESFYG